MASFADLAEAVWTQLEARALYPLAEVFANGINPAMRLMTLLKPSLLTQRVEYSFPAYSLVVDLRSVAPRTHQVLRVFLGAVGGDGFLTPAAPFVPLYPTTRHAMAHLRPDWLKSINLPRQYFWLGHQQLALWPRAPHDLTLTLTCAVVPTPATPETQQASPELDATVHDRIADLASELLRLKEGQGDTEQALQRLSTLLGIAAPAKGVAA